MKRIHLIVIVIVLALAAAAGWFGWQKSQTSMSGMPASSAADSAVVQDNSGKRVRYWYDPMVPTQKFNKPGKSPFMDMQLEPKYAEDAANGEEAGESTGVSISSQTTQNLGVRLAVVEMHSFGDSVSAVGRITPDERRFYVVQTRIPGFVEKLSVRAVGDPVAKGQKVAEIYAPELLAAQQEYLALLESHGTATTTDLSQAARSRLNLLGMSEREIAAITKTGNPSPRFGIYAPISGVLTELGTREGGQLMPGSSLMQISDLSQVWLIAEVPERDAGRIKLGSATEIQLQSAAGQVLKGKVDYLYPSLDTTTRTLQVRIELPNKVGNLRPGMYANVVFAGQSHEALSVPTESIIATGTRKVVIVKQDKNFRPVEIVTGQERDGCTEILKGLSEGESVVASGQFLIDSEASLSGVLDRLTQQPLATETLNKPPKAIIPSPSKGEGQDGGEVNQGSAIAHPNSASDLHPGPPPEMGREDKMPVGQGQVVDVDAKSGKVTLAHEPIAELGWPSMTMGFSVSNSKQLAGIKAGDQVEFKLKSDPKTEQYNIEQISKKMGAK